jgi:type IV pilus assembly protein PilA
MALITCPDCGTQASDQAFSCPRCARPLRALAPKKGMSVALIILIVAAVLIVPVVGILATLSIYGTRKYIANAKTAEAKNTLGFLAKQAVAAYEAESLTGDSTAKRHLCASASAPVPADRLAVSGKKYQSSAADWQTDAATNAGFACLKFEMGPPQYFQYEYTATASTFTVRAHGDLNGDGKFSTFELKGQIVDDHVVIAPAIREVDPEE